MAKVPTKPASMEDILDQEMGDWEAPKPLPPGAYQFVIDGQPRHDKSSRKQTPFVEFRCRPLAALDDVDEEALAEAGGLDKKSMRLTFYLTEEAKYRLQDFLRDDLGLEVEGKKTSQVVSEAVGCQFVGMVKHQNSPDGERTYAAIDTTAPVE